MPGSPLVAERTVELLRADERVEVDVVAGISFVDLAWRRLGVDPFAAGARLVDGQRFATAAAGQRGPFLVAQCDSDLVLSEIKLTLDDALRAGRFAPQAALSPDRGVVTVLARLGLPDESVRTVSVAELDRAVVPDHLTTLWIPELAVPVAGEVARLAELVRTLRQRCPWDREQTHRSLTRHLVEETYEVLEAIDELPPDAGAAHAAGHPVGDDAGYDHLEEELGDLLFQVMFHSALAAEAGRFDLADVAAGIHDKLVRRHPHVFGGVDAATAGQVVANWEHSKRAEKGRASVMDGVPATLPAALYAAKLQGRAASLGFDWDDVGGAVAKVGEERDELLAALAAARHPAPGRSGRDPAPGRSGRDPAPGRSGRDPAPGRSGRGPAPGRSGRDTAISEEVGDLLFAVVNVARHLDVDPEAALRHAAGKFRRRVVAAEALAAARGQTLDALDLAQLEVLWEQVKTAERDPRSQAEPPR